jgi:hypothetical protein
MEGREGCTTAVYPLHRLQPAWLLQMAIVFFGGGERIQALMDANEQFPSHLAATLADSLP